MLCESLMSRRCHSSQLFMAKFQSVCTLAGRRAAGVGDGAGEEGTEWTAPGGVSGSWCERRLKGKVKAAAKLLSRCSIWQNSSVSSPSLSARCFSAQVRRGHGRAAPSGLKSIVWLVKYQKCLFKYLGNQRRRIALVRAAFWSQAKFHLPVFPIYNMCLHPVGEPPASDSLLFTLYSYDVYAERHSIGNQYFVKGLMLHSEIMSWVSPLLNMAAVQQIISFSRKQEYVTFKNIIILVFVLSLLF